MKHTFTYDGVVYDHDSRVMQNNVAHLARVLGGSYYHGFKGRPWHKREQDKYDMHKAVIDMLDKYPPKNWHALVLEWPHVSASDPTKLAYTRSEEHGMADRQTVTTIGKYLTRHFIYAPSDYIRDLVAKHGSHTYKVVRTMREMLNIIYNGPTSCMSTFEPNDTHPYNVYDPELGWGMAARIRSDGTIDGRALIWQNPESGDNKTFVRTYARNPDTNAYSQADDGLKAWLMAQGYSRSSSWGGMLLRRIQHDSGALLMPYLDGDDKWVRGRNMSLLEVCEGNDDGEYECDRTDGMVYESEQASCDCCGCNGDPDDMRYVGRDEDTQVCDTCADEHYVTAISRRGYEAYIHREDVVYVDSRDAYYDEDYLADNGIIELYNGDYEHIDDCVHLEARDIYVHNDDDCVQYCEATGYYEHIGDCVCLHDDTYALEDDCVELHDGQWALEDDTVQLHDGDYALEDDAEELHDGDYALEDDAEELHDGRWALCDDVVQLHDGDYALMYDAWECDNSGEFYLKTVMPVRVFDDYNNTLYVHPDYAHEHNATPCEAPTTI